MFNDMIRAKYMIRKYVNLLKRWTLGLNSPPRRLMVTVVVGVVLSVICEWILDGEFIGVVFVAF